MQRLAWEIPVLPHEAEISPFRSDLRAFDILRSRGLNTTGVEIIKQQVAELSAGYRSPEKKLADVLEGGAIMNGYTAILLHGFGGIERGKGSGDCSEAARALTSGWAQSSMHRHLAKAGLHPFYLEVAAPRLFSDIWDDGSRVRSGHVAVALGSPNDYLYKGSDESFILIDPALGVVAPMNKSAYTQTGYIVVPEHEQRRQFVPLAIEKAGAENPYPGEGVPSLVLGTDDATQFVYSFRMKETNGYILPEVAMTDNGKLLVSFDPTQPEPIIHEFPHAMTDQALAKFYELAVILLQKQLRCFYDGRSEDEYFISGETKIKTLRNLHYPRPDKLTASLTGLEAAAVMATETGRPFTLLM